MGIAIHQTTPALTAMTIKASSDRKGGGDRRTWLLEATLKLRWLLIRSGRKTMTLFTAVVTCPIRVNGKG